MKIKGLKQVIGILVALFFFALGLGATTTQARAATTYTVPIEMDETGTSTKSEADGFFNSNATVTPDGDKYDVSLDRSTHKFSWHSPYHFQCCRC